MDPPSVSFISRNITHKPNFSKYNVSIDFDAYQEWRTCHPLVSQPVNDYFDRASTRTSSEPVQNNETSFQHGSANDASIPGTTVEAVTAEARYPTSFSHIVELITSGQPVPGIKDVPDTLLSGQDSPAATARRKKPWEGESRDSGMQYPNRSN
jgi:hypothetical protein